MGMRFCHSWGAKILLIQFIILNHVDLGLGIRIIKVGNGCLPSCNCTVVLFLATRAGNHLSFLILTCPLASTHSIHDVVFCYSLPKLLEVDWWLALAFFCSLRRYIHLLGLSSFLKLSNLLRFLNFNSLFFSLFK